ncbi:3-methyl-2-oxobutanoate hydroxymethyltransferase [Campylobacter sp.]|uniref:3-methyl-2-oxobutanoate hydroxymethyltransferase n=1 Tax=Campylobacter sp. TaxID=205 RepID=UPI002702C1D9|nr:3-methyl-2-oxobutanoate hydroxymethyltransferase [Campylobacter sp.]
MPAQDKKITITDIKNKKNISLIVMITAYDALFAKLFDEHVDIILIGDSLNMSFNGEKDTLDATMDMMLYHSKAVSKGAKRALTVADMPFGSYIDEATALKNAVKFIKESGVDAVKLEGGERVAHIVEKLCTNGISVMGHIGLMPQRVRFEGGYKIKGRKESEISNLINDAKALERAGVFAIVLEGTISDVAKEVAESVSIPVIGIGSGKDIDGQVLVFSDMLGLFEEFRPKFAKRYLDGANLIKEAIKTYADEVRSKTFPSEEFEYKN